MRGCELQRRRGQTRHRVEVADALLPSLRHHVVSGFVGKTAVEVPNRGAAVPHGGEHQPGPLVQSDIRHLHNLRIALLIIEKRSPARFLTTLVPIRLPEVTQFGQYRVLALHVLSKYFAINGRV